MKSQIVTSSFSFIYYLRDSGTSAKHPSIQCCLVKVKPHFLEIMCSGILIVKLFGGFQIGITR